jgi:hypothetical protein
MYVTSMHIVHPNFNIGFNPEHILYIVSSKAVPHGRVQSKANKLAEVDLLDTIKRRASSSMSQWHTYSCRQVVALP